MGTTGENPGMAADESQKQEKSDRWNKERRQNSAFRVIDWSMSSWEFGAGSSVSRIERAGSYSEVTLQKMIPIRVQCLQTRIISIRSDDSKRHGYHLQTVWLRWTSCRCSISLSSSKNGRCSQIIENSNIGMIRHLDSSSTTQMTQIMFQHGRPSRSSRRKSVRSSSDRTIMGRQFEKVLLEHGWKKFSIANVYLSTEQEDYRYQTENTEPTWKILMQDVVLGEPTSFLYHVYLGCTQREFQISNALMVNYRDMFEFWISAGDKENYLPELQGNLMQRPCLLGSMTWRVTRRNVWTNFENLQIKRLNQQLYEVATPCMDDHQFKEEENAWVGVLTTVCSQIVPKCMYLARVETWYFVGCEQICSCSHNYGQNFVTNAWRVWCRTSIIQVNTGNIVMWETQHNIAD